MASDYGQGVSDALYGGFLQGDALRQQKREQDFQNTATQLFNNRTALQQKLSTLKDADGNPLPGYDDTMNALTQNESAIRQHWHPDKNPGMLQKFGHMITDHLGITDPNQRTLQANNKALDNMQGDKTRAAMLATAAPLSPAQTAMQNVATQGKVQAAQMKQVMDNYDQMNPNASPQQRDQFKKEYMESAFLGRRWNPLMDRGKTQLMIKVDKNGKETPYLHDIMWNRNTDANGNELDDSFFDDMQMIKNAPSGAQVGKTPSMGSALQIGLRAYAREHNIDVNALNSADINYVMGMQAQSKMFPTLSTSTVIKQGPNGELFPVHETNSKTPGAAKLVDPRGATSGNWLREAATEANAQPGAAGAQPGQPQPGQPGPASGQASPQDLRKEAEVRKPKQTASAAGGKGSGGVWAGPPIAQGRTPASDKALTAVDTAEGAYNEVVKAAHSTNPVDSQGIILSWLRGKVNRVTATEIAAVRNLGGVFDKFDGTVSSIEHGTMTPKQISWFVKNAKDNLDTARKVASKYTNPNGQGQTDSGGGGDWRSRAIPH